MHQESEYQDITDDDIYEKNKKKKTNKKDYWSDKALEHFLETLREKPVKEMNDRRNKWIMFSKRLEKKGTKKGMMRSRWRKGRKAQHSHRNWSCSSRRHTGKKGRTATHHRSKSTKRCRASSHLRACKNRYLQSIHWKM